MVVYLIFIVIEVNPKETRTFEAKYKTG